MDDTDIFRDEALELFDEVETTLLHLKDNLDDKKLLDKLFRDLHTVKGSGMMFGFDMVADLTHKLEDVVAAARSGLLQLHDGNIDSMLFCRDLLVELLHSSEDDQQLVVRLEQALQNLPEPSTLSTNIPPLSSTMDKENCWDFFHCQNKDNCPAPRLAQFDSLNSGQAAGRICWVVTGTCCGGEVQSHYNEKYHQKCRQCDFRKKVIWEEGRDLAKTVTIYRLLKQQSAT